MARGRPRRPPVANPVDEPIPTDSKDHFSPLLWMPHDEHRVSEASRESETIITVRSRHYDMQYYSEMEPYLQNLGVQHLVDILESESKAINASLIAGLVERWRPETHTFHLPFGEMTVTLQDVSALWGLPIQGVPVGGVSDPTDPEDWTINYMLAELLGVEPNIRGNEGKSKYCLDKKKLRAMFTGGLGKNSTALEIERYTRGFVMDLFGSVMFADSTGDTIPIMYLELLRDLQPPSSCRYNLGGAVLAHLYSNLCHGCKRKTKQIYGPILLLQHWLWSRLPVGVPVPNEDPWGEPDIGNRPAFGMKWYGRHLYKDNPHGKPVGIRLVRSQIQSLGEMQVIWTPYHELYTEGRLPQIVADDHEMWLYRGPLVCFWIVEHHYPDRVLRQFDFPPLIPADPDVPRSVIMSLHGIRHNNHWNRDWSEYHLEHYNKAANMSANLWQMPAVDAMQFQGDPLLRYQAWYLRVGMASVYIEGHYGEFLRSMIFDDDGYTPTGRKGARQLLLALKGAARSITCLGKRGYRAVGHAMLHLVAPCIEDYGHEAKLVTMLRDAGENIDWRQVQPDEPDAPLVLTSEMPPEPTEQPKWDYHRWVLCMAGWHAYRDAHGRPFLPPGPAYMPPPPEPREQHESPEIHPMQDDSLTFSHADIVGDDQWDTAASPPPRQPYPPKAHDWEASGSGAQPDYASQLMDSLFQTPPPPPATHAVEDPWNRALTMSIEAEPDEHITPARRAPDGELQWNDWHERIFSRENGGRAPIRFTPSMYQG